MPVTGDVANERAARDLARRLQAACSSPVTYDRLKQITFDEAIRIRNADPVNLETLQASSLVRIESPRVVSRDATLDVTVCSGRFILQIPPGAEAAFGGTHQLTADIQYAAQPASDGTGLVYQITGAEPIIYKLAAFDLKHAAGSGTTRVARAELVPLPTERPAPQPVPEQREPVPHASPAERPANGSRPAPPADRPAPPERRAASPSFNCRYARTAGERMVCGNGELAALDRTMAAQYYSALGVSDLRTRADLRRSRDRFLAYRDGCRSEACVADAYRDRMAEIDDIAGR
ncbi:MAG: hypothetical protein ABIT09_04060 [Croceibacterium sp.]